jgi:hypothetical protein
MGIHYHLKKQILCLYKINILERFDPVVVEERRVATKSFLNYALQHLYLRTHEAYINFFQVIYIISLLFYHLFMLIQFRKVKRFYYLMLKQLH